MWVECIDNKDFEHLLTLGTLYKDVNRINDEDGSFFLPTVDLRIKTDVGLYLNFNSHRFKTVSLIEARDRQLKSLGL